MGYYCVIIVTLHSTASPLSSAGLWTNTRATSSQNDFLSDFFFFYNKCVIAKSCQIVYVTYKKTPVLPDNEKRRFREKKMSGDLVHGKKGGGGRDGWMDGEEGWMEGGEGGAQLANLYPQHRSITAFH